MLSEIVSSLAGAKVLLFSELPKLFEENFRLKGGIFPSLDKNQGKEKPIHYYIIYARGKRQDDAGSPKKGREARRIAATERTERAIQR